MTSFTERYHELTKYNPQTIDKLDSVHWEEQPPSFKTYEQISVADKIPLQGFLNFSKNKEGDATENVTMEQEKEKETLVRLLYFSMGVTAHVTAPGGDIYLRANPSAGGLYPTEVYVAIRNYQEIPDGLYAYHPLYMELHPIRLGNVWSRLSKALLEHPSIASSNTVLLFSGIYSRSAWRYKERAYRRMLLDTGHALGNVLELAHYWSLESTPIGGFVDEELENLLRLSTNDLQYQNAPEDFRDEVPLLAVALHAKGQASESSTGQRPSLLPQEAVQYTDSREPFQLQQNSCERLYRYSAIQEEGIQAPKEFRPSVPTLAYQEGSDKKLFRDWNLPNILLHRRSCRQYNGDSIGSSDFRSILNHAFRSYVQTSWHLSSDMLNYYCICLNVEGLPSGIYQVQPPLNHSQEPWSLHEKQLGDFKQSCYQMCLGQELASDASFVMVYTVDFATLINTYGDRGYRYACMDAGQIGEQINLVCQQLGLGTSGIGGYFDDLINQTLGLPLTQGILYITTVGVPDDPNH